MIYVVNELTTESEISELYESIEVFIQDNFSEITFGSGELKCGMFFCDPIMLTANLREYV